MPLLKLNGEWVSCGVYLRYGVSRSDPSYYQPFPLPWGWKPTRKMVMAAERQLTKNGLKSNAQGN